MRALLILAAMWALGLRPSALGRETNSRAASARGARAYAAQHYDASVNAFGDAASLAPSPQTAFNLGTAQIAAGRRAEGSATLDMAMRAPSLRADALYNRGNSALAAKAWEHAIRDYTEALRLRPGHAQAKRNLEIALSRLEAMRQQQAGGSQQHPQQGSRPQKPQPQPSPSAKQQDQPQEGDAEALLRSVQQQEQEELARMKRARATTVRVGW